MIRIKQSWKKGWHEHSILIDLSAVERILPNNRESVTDQKVYAGRPVVVY